MSLLSPSPDGPAHPHTCPHFPHQPFSYLTFPVHLLTCFPFSLISPVVDTPAHFHLYSVSSSELLYDSLLFLCFLATCISTCLSVYLVLPAFGSFLLPHTQTCSRDIYSFLHCLQTLHFFKGL